MGVLSILNLAASVLIIQLLRIQNQKINAIMAKQEQFDAMLTRLDAATTEIANDLKALRDELGDTISDESLTKLDANIAALEEMGKDPENPVPDPE